MFLSLVLLAARVNNVATRHTSLPWLYFVLSLRSTTTLEALDIFVIVADSASTGHEQIGSTPIARTTGQLFEMKLVGTDDSRTQPRSMRQSTRRVIRCGRLGDRCSYSHPLLDHTDHAVRRAVPSRRHCLRVWRLDQPAVTRRRKIAQQMRPGYWTAVNNLTCIQRSGALPDNVIGSSLPISVTSLAHC
ncbi:hypothetical protein HDK64DRAFT_120349 [Phyllosticta capitalensis]